MILSVIVITDRVLPGMRERGWGRILTSTSGGGAQPDPEPGDVQHPARQPAHLVQDARR